MGHHTGILFNWSLALGAWALGGPYWGVIAFLAVALVRVSIDAHALHRDNMELKRRLVTSAAVQVEEAAPPESGMRPSQTALLRSAARA